MHWEGWLASLSSLVCGGALYLMQRALNKRDRQQAQREKEQERRREERLAQERRAVLLQLKMIDAGKCAFSCLRHGFEAGQSQWRSRGSGKDVCGLPEGVCRLYAAGSGGASSRGVRGCTVRELRLRGFAPQSTAAMLPCVHPPRISNKRESFSAE